MDVDHAPEHQRSSSLLTQLYRAENFLQYRTGFRQQQYSHLAPAQPAARPLAQQPAPELCRSTKRGREETASSCAAPKRVVFACEPVRCSTALKRGLENPAGSFFAPKRGKMMH
eukprot:TRINITY_DN9845_c0_g1_i4.p2 TRINITY_DN9845_c0_g1~~TRINITY_DN9845_c0_g1_i4.p2  ORF type:complete len:114 (+),score=23.85 TRINITY_DN9845_c0_g1_i4:202-543(+)